VTFVSDRKVMRRVATIGTWFFLVAGVAAQTPPPAAPFEAAPAEPVVSWGGEVDVASQYVWRGFEYSEGMVVWPTAWVSARGFTASLFFNYDPQWVPKWNEYDLTFTYEREAGRWTLAGGYARYVYYEGDRTDATSEIIGRIAFAAGTGEIFTTHAFDVETYKGGYYLETGYAVEHELNAKSTISADASVAFWSTFIDKYTAGTATHITDGTIGPMMLNVSYARTLTSGLAIRPHVSFIRIGDAEGRALLHPPGVTVGIAVVVGGG
jgi:hypothetical protein